MATRPLADPSRRESVVAATAMMGDSSPLRDVEAVRLLVRAVVARTMRLSQSHPDAEDCTAEALRRIVESVARVREGEPIGPWATGVARHVAIDWMRSQRRERARSADSTLPGTPAADPPDPSPTPEQRALDSEAMSALRRALAELPEGPREAMIAFHVEGLSYHEIAARVGVPMGTIATWIARSRQRVVESIARARRESR